MLNLPLFCSLRKMSHALQQSHSASFYLTPEHPLVGKWCLHWVANQNIWSVGGVCYMTGFQTLHWTVGCLGPSEEGNPGLSWMYQDLVPSLPSVVQVPPSPVVHIGGGGPNFFDNWRMWGQSQESCLQSYTPVHSEARLLAAILALIQPCCICWGLTTKPSVPDLSGACHRVRFVVSPWFCSFLGNLPFHSLSRPTFGELLECARHSASHWIDNVKQNRS